MNTDYVYIADWVNGRLDVKILQSDRTGSTVDAVGFGSVYVGDFEIKSYKIVRHLNFRAWAEDVADDGGPEAYLAGFRKQSTVNRNIAGVIFQDNSDDFQSQVAAVVLVYRIVPFGNAALEASDGNHGEAAISLVGDVAFFTGFGAVAKGMQATKAGNTLRVVSTSLELATAGARGVQSIGEFARGENADAFAHLGEASLLLLGVSSQHIIKLRATRAANRAAAETVEEAVENASRHLDDITRVGDDANDAANRAKHVVGRNKGVTNPEISKLKVDESFFPPGITSNRQFGKYVMKWGGGAEGAKKAIRNLTKEQLIQGGVTEEIAKKWQQFYANEFARNKNNLTAKFREELMRKAIGLLN